MFTQQDREAASVSATVPAFLVGRDAEGHWLALERHGLAGGLFLTEAAAVRYARFETDSRPGAVTPTQTLLTLRL